LSSEISVGKPEREGEIGIRKRRWVENIKMDLGEVRCDVIDSLDLERVGDQWWAHMNTLMDLRVL
jgi:hypothetical protein